MSNTLYSTHSITFPFHLTSELGEGEDSIQAVLKKATEAFKGDSDLNHLGNWAESDFLPEASPLAYNEHQYFFAYLRSALYGDTVAKTPGTPVNTSTNHTYHYFTFEFSEKQINRRYATRFKGSEFELEVDDMHFSLLRLTGAKRNPWYVGTFVLFLSNRIETQSAPDQILAINSALRQIYPDAFPYSGDIKDAPGLNLNYDGATSREQKFSQRPASIPDYQTVFGLELQDWLFMEHNVDTYAEKSVSTLFPSAEVTGGYPVHATLPKLIYTLIYSGYRTAIKATDLKGRAHKVTNPYPLISAIADSRAHVHSWYGNSYFSDIIKYRTKSKLKSVSFDTSLPNNWWYEFIHVDYRFTTHTHPHQRAEILKNQTDFRWAGYGTLYGFSRYSTVMLSDPYDKENFPAYTVWVFNNTYFTMVHLVLIQRAGIQLLAREVANYSAEVSSLPASSTERHKRAQQLAIDFSRFRERFYHVMVTPQDQGIDFYEKLRKTFDIDRLMADLEQEISFMTAQGELIANQQRAEAAGLLNLILAVALVPTIGTAYYGMNGFRSPLAPVQVVSESSPVHNADASVLMDSIDSAVLIETQPADVEVNQQITAFDHLPFLASQFIGILLVGFAIWRLQAAQASPWWVKILWGLLVLLGIWMGVFGLWIWTIWIEPFMS